MAARSVIVRLEAEVAGYIAGMGAAGRATDNVARQVVQSRRATEQNAAAMDRAGKVMLGFGAVSIAALGASAKAAMEWESAWAGVTKTVDGTPEQMDELETSLRGLAKTLPLTHTEIAGVAEAAGQLGVKRDDIAGFTKTMIDLGVSTNLTAEDAATNIAQISNIMGTMARDGSEGVARFGAALVALGNDGASTEADILSMAQRIAGAGASVGATESEVLALSNTLSSMGVRAELGGGVATRALLKMYSAVKDGGPKLNAFARTAGMSAAEFSKAYGDSPVRALGLVTAGLGRMKTEGGNVVQTMKEMGLKGTEELQVMLALASSGDLLNKSLDLGAKAWAENTALVEEATKRYETTDSKVKIAWNNIKDAAIDAGAVLLPVISGIAESVAGLAQLFGDLPKPVQGVITGLGGIVGVAALLGGAALMLIPKIASTRLAFTQLEASGSRVPGMFNKIAKGAAIGGAFLGVTMVLAKWAEADYMSKIDTGMGKVNLALQQAANSAPGAEKGLDGLFKDRDGGDLIRTVDNLDSALKRTFKRDGGQQFNDWGESLVNGLTGVKGSSQMLGDQFERLDTGLAEMVSNGNAKGAAEGFAKIQKAAEDQDISIDELIQKFPSYSDALKQAEADSVKAGEGGDKAAKGIKGAGEAADGAKAPSAELSEALEEIGLDASGAAVDLEKFADALMSAGLLQLSARDAARGFEEALDAVDEAVKANGKTMDITTDKGRANEAALDAVAKAGFAVVQANAKNGESQEVLQGNLTATYNGLIATAEKFGITGTAAEELVRSVLKIPAGVSIESWMSSQAKTMAEQTKLAIDGVDGRTANVYVNTHATTFEKRVGLPSQMADGSYGQGLGVYAPGKAGGGDLDDAPGPKGIDSKLFYGAKGEHVLTAPEVDAMGGQDAVYRFRAQVRAGNIPSHAAGGEMGTPGRSAQYSARSSSSVAANSMSIADAVERGLSGWAPMVTIDGRQFHGLLQKNRERR